MSLIKKLALLVFGLALVAGIDSWRNKSVHAEEQPKQGKAQADDHQHEQDEHSSKEEDSHQHKESKGHSEEEKDEHGHGHGAEEEESAARAGPNFAITEANRKDGLKLSDKAIKTLELQYWSITSTQTHEIPSKAMVYFKDEAGVYRLRNGWFKLVETKPIRKSDTKVTLSTPELQAGDQIVINGVGLLRIAELEAWGGSGDGHGH